MKPKAPKKRNPKPNCKSGGVRENLSVDLNLNFYIEDNYPMYIVTLWFDGRKPEFKKID